MEKSQKTKGIAARLSRCSFVLAIAALGMTFALDSTVSADTVDNTTESSVQVKNIVSSSSDSSSSDVSSSDVSSANTSASFINTSGSATNPANSSEAVASGNSDAIAVTSSSAESESSAITTSGSYVSDSEAATSVNEDSSDNSSLIASSSNTVNLGNATENDVASAKAVAEDDYNQTGIAQTITRVDAVSTNTKSGWVSESGNNYFYVNGEKANGYLNDGTNWYLFKNGQRQSDVQKWAGSYYYFDHKTYLRVDDNYVKSNWGDYYLFGSDGRIQTDVQKWAGTYYYFDHNTYLRVDNNYVKSNWGDYYLFGSDGRIQTDVQQWAGTYYYFDHNTYLRVDNNYMKSRWGDYYLFGSDGRIQTDVQKWAGTYYYFDHNTYLRVDNKYVKSNWGNWYLFKSNGRIASGWYTYGYSSYYFNPSTYLLEKVTSSKVVDGVDSWTIGDPMRPQISAVDISSYQYNLTQSNYNTLKSLGVKTVIVKLTEGTSYNNAYAATQIKYAQNAGLNVAVYDYAKFSSTSSAVSEANYMVNYLKKYGISKNVTVIADMEDTSTYSGSVAQNLNSFWSTLSNNGYTQHVVYTYVSYKYRDAVVSTVGKSKTWIAQYPYSPLSNTDWNSSYGAWQVSSQAFLPGYSSNLDVSVDYNGLLKNM